MNKLIRFLSWPVLCGVLAAVIILQYLNNGNSQHSAPANIGPNSYAQSVQNAAPAVVNIYTKKTVKQKLPPLFNDPFFRHFLERNNIRQKERVQQSLGSGVIMNEQGFILTNHHVINGAEEILILLHDGREALANIVGSDPDTDLAVLKIELDDLAFIQLGDPAQAQVGDVVLAIGNPYGFGQTVTQGIISATGRYGLQLNTYENYIQTDAAINPGNSGGALVDAQGKLLGINSAIYSRTGGSQGIGLAIPIDLALRIAEDLIQYGKAIRGWLGVEVQPLTAMAAQNYNLSPGNGVVVTAVADTGPAAQAMIKPGDIIVAINNKPIGDGNIGMNLIAATRPGEQVSIELVRNRNHFNVTAIIGSRPE
ncbi:trypsin-like peptidase domain-containing protein [Dasania sp. GY-MA-18]|uniref:Trypsin-like peptidase domain-containing protein n=1 Tax=Dasania phycosphaerae TaxID=2950436 RepID=A0A9J6RIE4_9GAMM|nr:MULTISPECIES: trypsin-like peptidase domain-containing protein [Dasania]MCR8921555.1 trypsin-like peptidase domain-containing protein [Dasania sp. GY-MA-18]MCZ0863983.1 trypsin-like peptidase domain-containing protein [Dasania phycosphaerae]MCZ0867711.1 trypsin-like peptidase domain-containing protein [Dasania phycosphaerae]